jgi:surface polysaccharide O-acyltransferase-like enzyme
MSIAPASERGGGSPADARDPMMEDVGTAGPDARPQPRPPAQAPMGHLAGLDVVRVLAVILVIAIHADHWPLQNHGADRFVWSELDLVSRVSVPLFVVLSGLLLAYRHEGELPAGAFVRRRIGRSLVPWLVWAPVYVLIALYLTGEVPQTGPAILQWLSQGAGHLWFLVLIPQLYALFLLWPRGLVGSAVAATLALLVQTGLCVYRLYAPATAPLNGVFLAYAHEFFFFWIGYFALGALLGTMLARGRSGWPAWPFWAGAIVGALLLVGRDASDIPNAQFAEGAGAFLRPVLPLFTVALLCAVGMSTERVLGAHPGLARAVSALSRYSLGIYIVHPPLMYLVARRLIPYLLHQHLPLSAAGFGLLLASTLCLALLVTRLLATTPLAVALGNARRPLRLR